jgi:hypothetical protein
MKSKLFLILLLPFFFTKINYAQTTSFDYNGYAEDLLSTTNYSFNNDRYYDNLVHARLNTRWYPNSNLTEALELRMRAYYGSTVENTTNFVGQIKSQHEFTQLDAVLWNQKMSVGYLQVDRAWLDWNEKNLEVTLGRQRIAWGTSWVWNPTDIFNPYNVLDFDYPERPGVDALRVQYYTGPVSKFELSVRPGKTKRGWIAAGLWSTNKWNYDFNLLAGIKEDRWIAGGSWAGSILGGGFRGEFTVSQKPSLLDQFQNSYVIVNANQLSDFSHPLISFVLSGDYTFTNSFYIHTEALYNNNGKTAYTGLYQQEAADLGMLSAAKWSIYQEFAYDITPLIRGSIFGLFNPSDDSYVLVPSVTYSVYTNVDLLVLGLIFEGKTYTEYGNYGQSVYVRLKYSF